MNQRNIGVLAASIAFSITFASYIIIEKYVLLGVFQQYPMAMTVSAFIGAIGIYSVLFVQFLKFVTYVTIRLTIGGLWYHLGRVEGAYGSARHGECHVSTDYGDCQFTGTTTRPCDDHPTSMWHSIAVARADRRIHINFASEGVDERHSASEGVMTLVVGHGALWRKKLEGIWSDVAPRSNRGTITLFRSRKDYEAALNGAGIMQGDVNPSPLARVITVHPTALLVDPSGISIGEGSTIAEYVVFKSHHGSGGTISIGQHVEIKPHAYITSDGSRVSVGDNSGIGHGVWIGGKANISIGRNCLIAMNSVISSSERQLPIVQVPAYQSLQVPGPVTIGDNVFIGAGAVVLPGVNIGEGSVIGAGSVVTRDIPSHTIAFGSPARPQQQHST